MFNVLWTNFGYIHSRHPVGPLTNSEQNYTPIVRSIFRTADVDDAGETTHIFQCSRGVFELRYPIYLLVPDGPIGCAHVHCAQAIDVFLLYYCPEYSLYYTIGIYATRNSRVFC